MTEAEQLEEARQAAIASSRDYLGICTELLDQSNNRKQAALDALENEAKVFVSLQELKVTWLERLAVMMNVNATRRLSDDKQIELVFADTDGDAVLDEETSEPVVVFDSFDDVSRMVISVAKKDAT